MPIARDAFRSAAPALAHLASHPRPSGFVHGFGAPAPTPADLVEHATPGTTVYVLAAASTVGAVACTFHGYRRTGSLGWALMWGLCGSLFPFIAAPVALAQGFGEPEK